MTEDASGAFARIYEHHDPSYGAFFEVTALLERKVTPFQTIAVFETAQHGRIMTIDGLVMMTERTDHVYHEHMAHIPMACVDTPRSVLVIGGGDGGVVTEICKHADVERIVLAELDAGVVELSRRWFPHIARGLNDPRVEVEIGDGAAYLAAHPGAFDVVVIDSTDVCEAVVPGEPVAGPLITEAFHTDLRAALTPGGVAAQVLGSEYFHGASYAALLTALAPRWPQFAPFFMPTPFYISGDWTAALMGTDADLNPRRLNAREADLQLINLDVARGALAQPNSIRRLLGELDR
ncbi:MAG: polyamine aminopropyltransferase [Maricaulaceae bacterium]